MSERIYDAIVVGGDSYIGNYLFRQLLDQGYEVLATTRRKGVMQERNQNWHFCDLMHPTLLPASKVTYLMAGITSFRQCDADPWMAEQINVEGTVLLAQRQIDQGSHVVFLSSAAVEHYPQRIYGNLKNKTEQELLEYPRAVSIIRCGPICKPMRLTYADGPYQPVELDSVVAYLVSYMRQWTPGLHRLLKVKEPII